MSDDYVRGSTLRSCRIFISTYFDQVAFSEMQRQTKMYQSFLQQSLVYLPANLIDFLNIESTNKLRSKVQ